MRGGASRKGGSTNRPLPRGVLAANPLYHFFFPPSAFRIWKRVRAGGVLPTVGGFFPPWGSANCGIFFPPTVLLSAFRIWKQGRAGGGLLPRLSGFGNRVHAGGGCRYTQGGCRSTKLRHRHCPKSTVSSIILVPSAFRIWKQGAVSVIRRGGRFSKFRHL